MNENLNRGILYVVATPIGNIDDLSHRALETLKLVDIIYAEDSRQTGKLLDFFGIKKSIYALHKHNENSQKNALNDQLNQGSNLAIVSDAGTPLIADPGYTTLNYLREQQHTVKVIPGCSSVIAALSISGLPSDCFQFAGFIPSKPTQRQQFLNDFLYCHQTTVFFETPHRIAACLNDFSNLFTEDRQLFIARELTKKFEESALLPIKDAKNWINAQSKRDKGEFVIILSPCQTQAPSNWESLAKLMLAENISTKTISKIIASHTNENKKNIYQHVLGLKNPKRLIETNILNNNNG